MKTLALAFLMLPFAAAACSSSDGDVAAATGAGGMGAAPRAGAGSVSNSGGAPSAGGFRSGGVAADAGNDGDAGAAPCMVTATEVECRSEPIAVVASGTDSRRVYWARPLGAAPSAGFPSVILFQGSFFGPSTSWNVRLPRGTTPFGGDVQVALVATLVEHGFIVVQPEAQGGIAWN